MLNLILKRSYRGENYSIGHLYKKKDDGSLEYICDTIEDKDRGLNDSMSVAAIKFKKIFSKTAIPTGTYEVTLNVKSPKYSNFSKYGWAREYNGYLPRLLNVKGYDGILMHVGNTEKDSSGCLIVGYNKVKGKVINSTLAFRKLMHEYLLPAKKKNEKIQITIEY